MTLSIAIAHANLVQRHAVIEDGAVLVRDGIIVQAGPCSQVDWQSADTIFDADHRMYLLPGLVDTHCDGLEMEINPRPRVNFQAPFAVSNYERRALAAGVTTSFHAITFANMGGRIERTVDEAGTRTAMLRAVREGRPMDHQVLHRCDVWSPDGVDLMFESLRAFDVQAMSLNDHTPGQGQYRNLDEHRKTLAAYRAAEPGFDVDAEIQRRIDARTGDTVTVPEVVGRVHAEHQQHSFTLASHDDDSVEKVEWMHEVGCTVAEFPVMMEAAQRARELGMAITVGAPNIVRGGSTSGNQDATELVAAGLADIICADYHTPSILVAAFKLADLGLCTLPEAVAMASDNPARAFNLHNRGRIEAGCSADLALVDLVEGHPVVQAVTFRGQPVYQAEGSRPLTRSLAGASA